MPGMWLAKDTNLKKGVLNMPEKEVGVITEQGFVAGQFGYDKLNEADQAKLREDDKKRKEQDR